MAVGDRRPEPAIHLPPRHGAPAVSGVTGAGLAPAGDPTAAAFFDVDNTIVRGASIYHLARGLYRRRFFTLREITGFAWHQARFLTHGERLGHLADIQARALAFVAGHSVAELTAIGEEVYEELLARIWPGTQELAWTHLVAGQRVWLVTATPVEVASVIARRLGLTGALGTVGEQVDGIYTGRLVGEVMHGAAKARAVRELAAAEGLDLSRCSAYSDSVHDLPLLDLVGHPYAINPDGRLKSHAKAHAWPVQDFRTRRKAVKIGVPTAAVAGATLRAVLKGMARHRRRPG